MKFCIHQQDELECKDCRVTALQQEVARLTKEVDHFAKQNLEWSNCAEKWKNRAESAESSLLAMREALETMRDGTDTEKLHCIPVPLTSDWRYVIDKALSTTSAQAEAVKARWQAEALEEAAKEMGLVFDPVGWLRARAAQLTAPAVAKEKS